MGNSAYERSLEHMARPSDPDDRTDATRATLTLPRALRLREMLREWANYYEHDPAKTEIAEGYKQYIEERVVEELRGGPSAGEVHLYVHTPMAAEVLISVFVDVTEGEPTNFETAIEVALQGMLDEHFDMEVDDGG